MIGLSSRKVFIRTALSLCFVAGVFYLGLFFYDQYKSRLIEDKRVETEATLNLLGEQVSQIMERRLELLSGLERFVLDRSDREIVRDFVIFAEGLQNNVQGIRNVGIAPSGVLTNIYPVRGNEAAIGYNLFEDQTPSVRGDVSRAIMTKEVVLSDPFELRQGGMGVAARKAIYKDGKLWGLVSVVVDIPTFTESIESVLSQKKYDVSLRNKQGDVFWGDNKVFENNPVIKQIDTVDGFWEIGGVPMSGWEMSISSGMNLFVILELFFAALLIVVAILVRNGWEKPENLRVGWRGSVEAAKPAILYFVFGSLWILFSDSVLGRLVYDPELLTKIALIKGWGFVIVTALLLYLWMVQSFDKLGKLISMLRRVQVEAKLGYYVFDIKNGLWDGSGFLKEIFGIDSDYKTDFIGWVQLIAPDQRQMMTEYFQNEVLGKKRQFDKEYRVINRKTGRELWVHGLGSLEFDKFGNPVRMTGTIQDITSEKTREIMVAESEIKFKYLFDDLDQGVILHNTELEIVDINKRGAKILEIPKEQLIGKKIEDYDWKMISEKGAQLKISDFPAYVASKTGKPISNLVLGISLSKDDQSIKWLEFNSTPKFKNGIYEPGLIVTTFTDVTEKKMKGDEVSKVASFPELNTNCIFELDSKKNFLFKNQSFVQIVSELNAGDMIFVPEDFEELRDDLLKKSSKVTRYVVLGDRVFVVTMYIPKGEVNVRFNVQELEGIKKVKKNSKDNPAESLFVELPIKQKKDGKQKKGDDR